jgi:hypothetical protein
LLILHCTLYRANNIHLLNFGILAIAFAAAFIIAALLLLLPLPL